MLPLYSLRGLFELTPKLRLARPPCSTLFLVDKIIMAENSNSSTMTKRSYGSRRRTLNNESNLRVVSLRQKYVGPCSANIRLHVFGTGGVGCPTGVMVATDFSRFMFNCGESTLRLCNEYGLKYSKLENVFITHKSWQNLSGLIGICLSAEAVGIKSLNLHGPPNVENVTNMMDKFAESSFIKLEKKEIEEKCLDHPHLKIEYVPFYSNCNTLQEDTEESSSKRLKLDETREMSVAYLCTPSKAPRTLDIQKCAEIGIEPGPIFRRIKDGETVTLEDGRVIEPDQVLFPPEVSKPFLVVECVNVDYLESLMASEELKKFIDTSNNNIEDKLCLIVHMAPKEVSDLQQYQDWMKSFGVDTEHLMLDKSCSEINNNDVYKLQTQLNLINPVIFPLLPHQLNIPPLLVNEKNIVKAEQNMIFEYRPFKGINREQVPIMDIDNWKKLVTDLPDFQAVYDKYFTQKASLNIHQSIADRVFPEVVFLGTGASNPAKYRNVSCILVRINENSNFMFDCGESTATQLYRHYGQQTDEVLMKLKGVFISHMHADHHLGIFSVIQDRKEAFERHGKEVVPLVVIAPYSMKKWIFRFSETISPVTAIKYVPVLHICTDNIIEQTLDEVLLDTDLQNIVATDVKHTNRSYGVKITCDQFQIVYSGDTMPGKQLATIGKNCDLLIHEATFDDNLEQEAKFKRHSTVSQAVEVGRTMNAKFVILNHFSQRYAKVPVIDMSENTNVGIAFDNMRVRPCDLPVLPLLIPCIQEVFHEALTYLDEIKEKKQKTNKMIESFSKSDSKPEQIPLKSVS